MKFVYILIALIILPWNVYAGGSNNTIILVSNDDAFYTLIATPLSFHLGEKPVLLFEKNLTQPHKRFIDLYGGNNFIIIGKNLGEHGKIFEGDAVNISIEIAKEYFKNSRYAVIVPYNNYSLSLISTPIACYLNAPLLIYKNNSHEIRDVCREINAERFICIGDVPFNGTSLNTMKEIYDYIKSIHKIKYVAIANPEDVIKPSIIDEIKFEKNASIFNIKFLFGIELNIFGNDKKSFEITVPDGTCLIKISVSGNAMLQSMLYDENNTLISYSNSMAFGKGKNYMECLTNKGGKYRIDVTAYNGWKSGFFLLRGFSFVNTKIHLRVKIARLSSPTISNLHISKLTPLLACHHRGMVFATFHDTGDAMKNLEAAGGGWCSREMQAEINRVVNTSIREIRNFLDDIDAKWLAIVGDSNMIPMYYYPMEADPFVGYGIPSDMPYFMNLSIAVGRVIAMDDVDTSLLIARSIFYDKMLGEWKNRFTFISGEGFGETGSIFHQIPYSKEVKKLGFNVSLYGDFRNDREFLENEGAFNANYIEYEGHGDWFWMAANLYTNHFNNVDAFHTKGYKMNPSIILTSACLMGRIDGIPQNGSIAMAFIHAGSIAFIGATRETGKEAIMEIIEDNLLKNNTTIGEAVLKSKLSEEMPTKVARVLYGDPAFNPAEP